MMAGGGRAPGLGCGNRGVLVLMALLVLSTVVFRVVCGFRQPFRADEFLHLHGAWMVAQGHLPYRDYFEHHACGYHYLMAPLMDWVEPEAGEARAMRVWVISRGLSVVLGLVALGVWGWVSGKWLGVVGGLLTVVLAGTVPFFLETSVETRPDVPAMLLWVVGVGLLLGEMRRSEAGKRPRAGVFLGMGLAVGLAVMFTQKALFLLPGVGVAVVAWWLAAGGEARTDRGRALMLGALGLAVPTLLFVLWFGWRGAAWDFWDKVFAINARWAYEQPAALTLAPFLAGGPVLVGLGLAGMAWVAWRGVTVGRVEWAGATCALVVLGWAAGLLWVVPVVDRQFYLIPVPFLGFLGARVLVELLGGAGGEGQGWRGWRGLVVAGLVGLHGLIAVPMAWRRATVARPGGSPLDLALWVIRHTGPGDAVMDGWTGAGVFRPQAWYYGFVHPEVPPMIPRAAAADVVGRLAEGVLRPRIVVDDSNFGFLHPDLPTLLGDGYQYDPERRLFVRREVVDGGSAGGGVVPWGSEHRRVRTPER